MKTIDINFFISGTRITIPFNAICSITSKPFSGNIIIEYCYFEEMTGGIYLINCSNITIRHCYFQKIYRDPNWGSAGNTGRGQAIQLNGCTGTSLIEYCYIYNPAGYMNEDMINLYNCNFSSEAFIQYCEARGTNTFSPTGGGFLAGDGNNVCQNITIRNCKLSNPGQYGICIAGGNNNKMQNNQVFGASQPNTNVGMYIGHYANTLICDLNSATDNVVFFRNAAGTKNNYFWDVTPPNNCTNTTQSNNTDGDGTLTVNLVPIDVASEVNYEKAVYDSL